MTTYSDCCEAVSSNPRRTLRCFIMVNNKLLRAVQALQQGLNFNWYILLLNTSERIDLKDQIVAYFSRFPSPDLFQLL